MGIIFIISITVPVMLPALHVKEPQVDALEPLDHHLEEYKKDDVPK